MIQTLEDQAAKGEGDKIVASTSNNFNRILCLVPRASNFSRTQGGSVSQVAISLHMVSLAKLVLRGSDSAHPAHEVISWTRQQTSASMLSNLSS
jgi:hypothetical protein